MQQSAYIKYAKWELRQGQPALARAVFERTFTELADHERDEELYIQFAKFEERCKEYERARVIYKYALSQLSKAQAAQLYKEYTAFEKQHGERKEIEDVIIGKRRFQYEEAVKANPTNYDAWFDFARLEETNGNEESAREVYERAIANVPPVAEKKYWRRYIYLWINYALYEELEAKDMERTRKVYRAALNVVPHSQFTFAKLWLLAANFEVRQKDLKAARKLLGTAVGMCPKEKLFKGYIDLELQLGNVDRCRALYQNYLKFMPQNCQAWIKFAELEKDLNEISRARAIFKLAIQRVRRTRAPPLVSQQLC